MYENGRVRVIWDSEKCSGADVCIRELPQVFDNNRDPWVDVGGAEPGEIARVAEKCPAGALRCQLPD